MYVRRVLSTSVAATWPVITLSPGPDEAALAATGVSLVPAMEKVTGAEALLRLSPAAITKLSLADCPPARLSVAGLALSRV